MFANRFPTSRLIAWFAGALCLASMGASDLAAQEVRTTDGRVLVGKIVRRGDTVLVETRFGSVSLRKEQIESERDEATLMREYARFKDYTSRAVGTSLQEDAQRQLDLAELAARFGLEKPLWSSLDQLARARDAANGAFDSNMEDALDRFLPTLETFLINHELQSQSPRKHVRALLTKTSKREPHRDLVIARTLAMNPTLVQEAATRARKSGSAHQRQVATESVALHARMLTRAALLDAASDDSSQAATSRTASAAPQAMSHADRILSAEQFVARTALVDTSNEVRQAATRFTRSLGRSTDAVHYLGSYLHHPTQLVRIRTAEALGNLGNPAAIDVLVHAGPTATLNLVDTGTPGTRANVAFTEQQSYVRDYNVEVASGAFIADPVVDVLQSGVVLDVTVLAVTTERVVRDYRRALQKLSGSDPGPEAGTWEAWLRQWKASKQGGAPADTPEKR